MAGFLYYFPGPTTMGIEQVREAGLSYAFDSANCTPARVMANGLDGGAGVVAADATRVKVIGLYPDKQTWRKIPGREIWAGFYTHDRPKPADLERKNRLNGHLVELLDGNEWLCPVARSMAEQDGRLVWDYAVPTRSMLNDDGEVEPGEVVEKYATLWEMASRWNDVRKGAFEESDGKTVSFSFDNVHHSAVTALAVNYVIGPVECDLLGLLGQDVAVEILDALIDQPTWFDLLKKMADRLDTSNTEDGLSADTPVTDQL